MRLVSIVCVQKEEGFKLIYFFDEKGKVTTKERNITSRVTKSIMTEHPSAEFYEREIHDFYDVEFEGNNRLHPLFISEEDRPTMVKKNA